MRRKTISDIDAAVLDRISEQLMEQLEDSVICDIDPCDNTADWAVSVKDHRECWGQSLICNEHRDGYARWVLIAAMMLFGFIEGACPKCNKQASAKELTWVPLRTQ